MGLNPTISRAVYQRDDWRCRHCRNREGLHPHHVYYKGLGGGDTLNNLLTLCWKCHRNVHDGFLKIEVIELLEMDLVVKFLRQKGWKP
jgi:5-methylcytosine-specific restriction endonuclease McrA